MGKGLDGQGTLEERRRGPIRNGGMALYACADRGRVCGRGRGDRCRERGWQGAVALQTQTGDAPIAPSSFIAMPLSQLVVRSLSSHDRSESGTVGTTTALLPLATPATLPISIRERARPIRVAPFDTTAERHNYQDYGIKYRKVGGMKLKIWNNIVKENDDFPEETQVPLLVIAAQCDTDWSNQMNLPKK
ncbi:hypothetical protein WH47_11871 [Habropoda laboriosa]|uniref:Uncharacterized protein n=1 Tax=Habropoda laboriosa TaxID=597456 RepID=A0A0L7R8P6_9HYME|nr:hypothetical protein WH47_11871 [Habropoda laboriosa]